MRYVKENHLNRIVFGSKCIYPVQDLSPDTCKVLCMNTYLCAAAQHRVYANNTVATCDILFDSKSTFVCGEGGTFVNASSDYEPGHDNPYAGLEQRGGQATIYSNSTACYFPENLMRERIWIVEAQRYLLHNAAWKPYNLKGVLTILASFLKYSMRLKYSPALEQPANQVMSPLV